MGSILTHTIMFQPPEVSVITNSNRQLMRIPFGERREGWVPAFYIDHHSPFTIIFSHGNAEDIHDSYDWIAGIGKEAQVNVLSYEYNGYGNMIVPPREPSESACYDAIDAAFTFLVTELGQSPANIILYGRSLGTGPTCYLAAKLGSLGIQLGAVVLQSPMLSVYRVALNVRFTLPGDIFANIDRICDVKCPLFFIHGTRDEVVPCTHSERLFALCRPEVRLFPPLWVRGAGHNDIDRFLRCSGSCGCFDSDDVLGSWGSSGSRDKRGGLVSSYNIENNLSANNLANTRRWSLAAHIVSFLSCSLPAYAHWRRDNE